MCKIERQNMVPPKRLNLLLSAEFLDFRFCTSRPVARAKLIQMGQLFHSIVVWARENAWVESQPMSLAGCGLSQFRAKMPEIHLFQTKSHTRHALSWSSMAMWMGEGVQCYHVATIEPLLACGVLGRGKVDAQNGATLTLEWRLGSLTWRIQVS